MPNLYDICPKELVELISPTYHNLTTVGPGPGDPRFTVAGTIGSRKGIRTRRSTLICGATLVLALVLAVTGALADPPPWAHGNGAPPGLAQAAGGGAQGEGHGGGPPPWAGQGSGPPPAAGQGAPGQPPGHAQPPGHSPGQDAAGQAAAAGGPPPWARGHRPAGAGHPNGAEHAGGPGFGHGHGHGGATETVMGPPGRSGRPEPASAASVPVPAPSAPAAAVAPPPPPSPAPIASRPPSGATPSAGAITVVRAPGLSQRVGAGRLGSGGSGAGRSGAGRSGAAATLLTGGDELAVPLTGVGAPSAAPGRLTSPGRSPALLLKGQSAGAGSGARRAAPPHPRSSSSLNTFLGGGAIVQFIRFIPTWVWILLGCLAALAVAAGAAAAYSARAARRNAAIVAEVSAAALTDPLTGALNRRGFVAAFERELDRARRYGRPLALAFLDVRGLKAVNDRYGHQAGDRLLRDVADLLHESARAHDVVGRIGGDELAVLLPEQSAAGVARVVQRVRAQIPRRRSELSVGGDWDLTVGVALFPEDGDDVEELFGTADRRLYEQRGISLHRWR